MSRPDAVVHDAALMRISDVFHIPIDSLVLSMRFGIDLVASFVSDFRRNELDQIGDDIRDVANRSIIKDLNSGQLVIRTIEDYCRHMVRCAQVNPRDVNALLKLV